MKNLKNKNRQSWFDRHPWLPGILTIVYVLFGLLIPLIVIYIPSIGDDMPRFFKFVSFVLITGPIVLTILQLLHFRHSLSSIRGLAMLYLEIILMFGVIYFYAVSANSDMQLENPEISKEPPPVIRGIDTDWVYLVRTDQITDKQEVLENMLVCFQDCIHFSLITSTTVGYGDMIPATPIAKLLVDLQVLISFFLISFGVAFFFSTQHSAENHTLAKLEERIKSLEESRKDLKNKKMKKKKIFILKSALFVIGTLFYLWCIPALYFSFLPWIWLRIAFATLFTVAIPVVLVIFRCNKKSIIGVYISFLLVICFFHFKRPSNDRDWVTSVAVLPSVEINDNLFDIHNIRNFKYRSENDFSVRYYDRTFDLNKLNALYISLSYWDGNKNIAHAIYSFGFDDGKYLAISSEIRMTKGREQSLLGGLFNEYEIIYILADEEDVLKLRTNYRKEEVFMYHVKPKGGIADVRKFFVYVMEKVDTFEERPKFYNTFTTNCLTSLLHDFATAVHKSIKFDFRLIENGYFDELMYERGVIETGGLSFPELKKQRHINQYVKKNTINYSQKIRPPLNSIRNN